MLSRLAVFISLDQQITDDGRLIYPQEGANVPRLHDDDSFIRKIEIIKNCGNSNPVSF